MLFRSVFQVAFLSNSNWILPVNIAEIAKKRRVFKVETIVSPSLSGIALCQHFQFLLFLMCNALPISGRLLFVRAIITTKNYL